MYAWTEVNDAKSKLGVGRLILQIQDASFPADLQWDIGRGSPYSLVSERFFEFAARLGFDAVQLGPQGMTSRGNPSPYDSTLFSRNPMNLSLGRLVQQGRIDRNMPERLRVQLSAPTCGRPTHASLFDAYQQVVAEILKTAAERDRASALAFLAANEAWLLPDALYLALSREHGSEWWPDWGRTSQGALDRSLFDPPPGQEKTAGERLRQLREQYEGLIMDYALIQQLLHLEHAALRRRLGALNLALYGDLQVGLSPRDTWARQHLLMNHYRMGAPPSRTNPEGQPWGYPVLDPRHYGTPANPGPVLRFVQARVDKLLEEYDGIRVDHPHGWIDPWVYRENASDAFHDVQKGARLFSTPDDSEYPPLNTYAIARSEQIDRARPRYSDERVTSLDEEQVTRYAILMDALVKKVSAGGRARRPLACEVLSTMPYPVRRTFERYGLGRFRVVQKIRLDDPADVYRVENAKDEDWIMLGTHDTAPVWDLARRWCLDGAGQSWAEYLARMLTPAELHGRTATAIAHDPGELVHSLFAAMLASKASQVLVFFADLFGLKERYNEPGVISEDNWRLRVPADFESFYENRRRLGLALDIGRSMSLALRAPPGQAGCPG